MVIFFIVLILLLIPIPLFIRIYVNMNSYYIKVFNVTILSSKRNILYKSIEKTGNIKKTKPITKKNKAVRRKKLSFSTLFNKINNNKFKPYIKTKGNLDISLDDAAITAIIYGLLCNVQVIMEFFIHNVFNVKKNIFHINPIFSNENSFKFTLRSIIYFNFAQIIYILYLIYISLENIEEVSPS